MRSGRGPTACLLASLVIASASRAIAEPSRSRVALVRTASSDKLLREATTRLRAELGDAGFDVVEVDSAPGDARDEVERAAEGGSFATVSMNRAGTGAAADIWISDHVTGKTVVRRLQVTAAPNAAAVLAIRALELLRASLLEVAEPEPVESAPAPAPADVMKWVGPALPDRVSPRDRAPFHGTALGVGAFGLHGLRGVGAAVGPTLRLSHSLYGPLFARLTLAGPLIGPELTESAGSASVRQEFASADLGWASRAEPFGGYAWVGVGAFDLHVTGSANNPYRSQSQGVLSFLSMAGVGGVARLGERLALTAEFTALSLIPQPVVIIANHDAGKAGAPSLGLSVGLLVSL
ncbi:MAG TPA: hypothetical protein VH062_07995 [Polyangiaceae bacterium]|jgi:hypothetical protein|nr:hypothetical protein [Polyangiaceae bacterium]